MSLIKSLIFFILLITIMSCASKNKGTKINYIPILNTISNCKMPSQNLDYISIPLNTLKAVMVGNNRKCLNLKMGKSFYSAFSSEKPFQKITIRSFYGLRGESAKLFFPEVATKNHDTGELKLGIIDEIVDGFNKDDGNYLKLTYIFNKPVNNVVIFTDSSQFKKQFYYDEKNYSAVIIGSAVIPFDFTNKYQIKYNAGGPIDLILEK